ncbi:facilitated trehalose transporter Tret1-like isoform X2 [Diorhabda carinulata]|uniref:facilitated trehalose transporter Tret1-like isoform X2 n=1 Tax=Diorhabda carinulata TaxID=1163345 RepID=UPI0025A0F0A5|nr:facilitated trehalose transporter Tret1-like isoform X2 [Diorhabda carinulata]
MTESKVSPPLIIKFDETINSQKLQENLEGRYQSRYVYITALTANILLIAAGFTLNWAAPVLPMLLSNNTDINPLGRQISTLEVSFLVATPNITGFLGFYIMAKVSDRFGRKATMIFSAIIHAFSFNVIAFIGNIYSYYICLLLIGIGFSGIVVSVSVYNVEISDKHNRDRVSSIVGIGIPMGVLLSFLFGSVTSVKVFSIINAVPAFLFLILGPFIIIESPVYHCLRGRRNEALISLERLRRFACQREIETEYLEILSNVKERGERKNSVIDLFKTKASKRALLLSIFLSTGRQTSGLPLVMTFIGIIFKDTGSSLSGNRIGILLGLEQVISIIPMIYFIKKLDRRYFVLASCLVASFSLFTLSLSLYLEHSDYNFKEYIRWLPPVSALLFMLGYNLGYGPLSLSLSGELFNNNLRSIGVGVGLLMECLCTFVVKFTFPLLIEALGLHFSLAIFTVTGLVNFTVFYRFLPETREKSLREIQKLLEN